MIRIKILTLNMIKNLIKNYHIYLSHYSRLPETGLGTRQVLNIQSRPEVETRSILKFPSRIPTEREIPSGLPVPADSLKYIYHNDKNWII